jgi:hypothetical protein
VSALAAGTTRPHLPLWVRLDAWLRTGQREVSLRRTRVRPPAPAALRAALVEALSTEPLPSLRAFAHGCGTTPATLSRRFPDLTGTLMLRRGIWLRGRAAARRQRLRDQVRTVAQRVGASLAPMPRRSLEAALGQPGLLRDPVLREAAGIA